MSGRAFAIVCGFIVILVLSAVPSVRPQPREGEPAVDPTQKRLKDLQEMLQYAEDVTIRHLDEQVLFHRLEDLAEVDKVRYTGPPPRVIPNPTGQGAGNPVVLSAYTFIPRKRPLEGKLPLIVLVHGGVHGNFNSSNVHIL